MHPGIAVAIAVALWACSASSDVSRTLGARCDQHDECNEICLRGADYPGGMCSLSCSEQGDCSGDSTCVQREQGVCLFSCEIDEDCGFLGIEWKCMDTDPLPDQGGVLVRVCLGA